MSFIINFEWCLIKIKFNEFIMNGRVKNDLFSN